MEHNKQLLISITTICLVILFLNTCINKPDRFNDLHPRYNPNLLRVMWEPASEPFGTDIIRGKVNWFNPSDVYYRDIYEIRYLCNITRFEKHPVLDIKIHPPEDYIPGFSKPVWGGLMRYIGHNIDFSNRTFINLLIKVDDQVFNDDFELINVSHQPNVVFYLDLVLQ